MDTVAKREDADRALSYYTKQQVLFLDWRLGIVFWSIQVSMAIVVIGYVLIYHEGYLDFERAVGSVVTHVAGDAVANSTGGNGPNTRYFSTEELTYPALENGNVFIATRQTVNKQVRAFCEDPQWPCETDSECTTSHGEGTCSDRSLCRVLSWCNVDQNPDVYQMQMDTFQIWVRSFIQFLRLAPDKIFTTDSNTSEPTSANTFTVRDLLSMVEPLPVNYAEVHQLGAIFEVGIRWDCYVHSRHPCKPTASIRRLDTLFDPDNIGFDFEYSEYVDDDHRLQYQVHGIRFLFKTTGVGKKVSVAATITKLSTTGTLLSLAIIITDLALGRVFKDRKKFVARKFEKTPDFRNYMVQREEDLKMKVLITDIEKAEQDVVAKEDAWLVRFREDTFKFVPPHPPPEIQKKAKAKQAAVRPPAEKESAGAKV